MHNRTGAAAPRTGRSLKHFLDGKAALYNTPGFIAADPVSVPHRFRRRQDIEIAGLFAAVFAWGNRTTIIAKARELMRRMDDAPHDFILHHTAEDLRRLEDFVHRTFNATDLLYFVEFLHRHYAGSISPPGCRPETHPDGISLETAFTHALRKGDADTGHALAGFHRYFLSLEDAPRRTAKHVATPERGSSCKRLNMFLRWMVRRDALGVDFGIWRGISPAQLVCPLDLHVARVARRFGLLQRSQADWKAAVELTENLRRMDRQDPVRYDFALFGLGIEERY